MTNISDYIYKLIDKNIDLLNIKNYDKDFKINLDLLEEYKTKIKCADKFINLIKKIYENIIYINCDQTIDIYNKNALEIKELVEKTDKIPVYIFSDFNSLKSNFYLNLYFINLCKTKYDLKFNYIYMNTSDVIDNGEIPIKIDELIDKNILLIYTDDITYSGKQLSEIVINLQASVRIPNLYIYINVLGYTIIAKNKIISSCQEILPNNIIFSRNAYHKEIRSINDLLMQWSIENKQSLNNYLINNDAFIIQKDTTSKKYIIKSLFNELFDNTYFDDETITDKTTPLIYPFFKYPDNVSFSKNICYLLKIEGYYINSELLKSNDNYDIVIKKDDYLKIDYYNLIPKNDYIDKIFDGSLKDDKFIKCESNDEVKFNNNIKIKKVFDYLEDDYIFKDLKGLHLMNHCDYSRTYTDLGSCNIKCKDISFYKKLEFKNLDDSIIKTNILEAHDSLFKNKYLKYKNKYLKLKTKRL